MSQKYAKCFDVAVKLIKELGKIIKEVNFTPKKSNEKENDIDLVTEFDIRIENLLIKGFSTEFPDHKFIAEEAVCNQQQSLKLTDDPTWIIDPIDGTLNFVHGFPYTCMSVALFVNKEPELAIIYNPNFEQLYTAQKGQGTFLNGKPTKVSNETELNKILLMFSAWTMRNAEKTAAVIKNYKTLRPLVHCTRSSGSGALNMALVASGGADAFFEFGTRIWDIAAGELLVKEAGGIVIDPAGGPLDRYSRRVLCACNKNITEKLVPKIHQFYPPRFDSSM